MNRVAARVRNRRRCARGVTTLQKRIIDNNISRPLKGGEERRIVRIECKKPRVIPLSLLRETYRGIILIRIDNLSPRNDGSLRSRIVNLSNWIYSWDYISQSKARVRRISNLATNFFFPNKLN